MSPSSAPRARHEAPGGSEQRVDGAVGGDEQRQHGLVTAIRIGKQKHYQANPAPPVFAELRALVLKTSGLADMLREALTPVADRLRAAFVYGSIAKAEDTAASDIDLMVISDSLSRCGKRRPIRRRRCGGSVHPPPARHVGRPR